MEKLRCGELSTMFLALFSFLLIAIVLRHDSDNSLCTARGRQQWSTEARDGLLYLFIHSPVAALKRPKHVLITLMSSTNVEVVAGDCNVQLI